MSKEIHINSDPNASVWFVRFNSLGQVALTDGSAWEEWAESSGYDIEQYRVPATAVGSGSYHYAGDFDAGGNIAHNDIQIYSILAFTKVGSTYTRIGQGVVLWDGVQKVEIDNILEWAGFTEGKTTAVKVLLKLLAAFIKGQWNLKEVVGDITTFNLSDADDAGEVVAGIDLKEFTNPRKKVTVL